MESRALAGDSDSERDAQGWTGTWGLDERTHRDREGKSRCVGLLASVPPPARPSRGLPPLSDPAAPAAASATPFAAPFAAPAAPPSACGRSSASAAPGSAGSAPAVTSVVHRVAAFSRSNLRHVMLTRSAVAVAVVAALGETLSEGEGEGEGGGEGEAGAGGLVGESQGQCGWGQHQEPPRWMEWYRQQQQWRQ